MNITNYIESGVLDVYVLGGLSAQEAQEVEQLAGTHPEIANEISRLQSLLEQLVAFETGSSPSHDSKSDLFKRIETISKPKDDILTPKSQIVQESKIVKLQTYNYWSIAASWVFVLGFAVLSYHYRSQWKATQAKLVALEIQHKEMAQSYGVVKYNAESANRQLYSLSDSSLKMITLKKVSNRPDACAQLFWNPIKKEVFLSFQYLPPLPKGKQYQLWAIVEGKPVDAGIIPIGVPALMVKMKDIANASAFAITLEQEGGSPVPTLAEMVVIGGV